jgi:NADH:ubiquinone oxidoreductase subunit 6 (subunit J)
MNQLRELMAIAGIFFGILCLLVAFILSAGVFLFEWFNSLGSYTIPIVCGIMGYVTFSSGFLDFLKQRRNPAWPFLSIINWVSVFLILGITYILVK